MLCLIVSLALLAFVGNSRAEIDPDKAAELSREIREHFRLSGANWVSPKMLNELDLARNQKPIIFIYTARSCADCRAFMSSWTKIDKVTVSSITAQFLSVLVLDDYIFDMTHFSPDEIDYLPRVFFADPDGTLRKDVTNPEADTSSPYYYESAQQVVEAMRGFLQGHWESLGTDVFKADLINDV